MTLFKRIVSVFFIAVLLITPTSANVKSATSQSDTMLTDVLKDKNRDISDKFFQLEIADEELERYDLENTPVLVVYPLALTNVFYEPLEDVMEKVKDNSSVFFVLLQEKPVFLLGEKSTGKISICNPYHTDKVPSYVQDVLFGSAKQTFQGQECNIQNVICYDGDTQLYAGITLVYETDRGRFVRHYEYTFSEPIEFTWDEFVKLQNGYRKYRVSRIPVSGAGQTNFATYSQNPDRYKPRVPFWQKLLVAGGIVAVGVIAVFIGIRLRKRYLRRKYAAFDIEI